MVSLAFKGLKAELQRAKADLQTSRADAAAAAASLTLSQNSAAVDAMRAESEQRASEEQRMQVVYNVAVGSVAASAALLGWIMLSKATVHQGGFR